MIEAEGMGEADPPFSWWSPRPSSTFCGLLVGVALVFMQTIDQNLAKPPAQAYGWPFTYQVVPHEFWTRPAPRFEPGWLLVDVMISAGILASAHGTAQWLAYQMFGPARYTVRSALLTIAALAVLLALYRLVPLMILLLLSMVFLFAVISPLFLIGILVSRKPRPISEESAEWAPPTNPNT